MRLPSGVEVIVRPIRADDKDLLNDGFSRLSWESAYRRFLTPKKQLTPSELRYFTEVDGRDHVALVAVRADEPTALMGVGRWVRSGVDPNSAEIAIVVADEMQGIGLGTALGRVLAQTAREGAIHRFTATMLPHNRPAHRLLSGLSDGLETTVDSGVYQVQGDLAA